MNRRSFLGVATATLAGLFAFGGKAVGKVKSVFKKVHVCASGTFLTKSDNLIVGDIAFMNKIGHIVGSNNRVNGDVPIGVVLSSTDQDGYAKVQLRL